MNYTSVEQSKKLLELGLSPESADIFIPCYGKDNYTEFRPYFREHVTKPDRGDLPCWSVGALLEVMPNHTEITKIDGLWTICASDFRDVQSDSLIDALVDKMILLLENNYIKQ